MFDDFTKFIAAQRELIAQAPISFIIAVVLGATIIWLFKRSIYRDKIAVLNERIRQRDTRIDAGDRSERKFNMQSTEQVVIVTGAASGIGQELCRLFARRGARIGLVDRDKSKLEAFADELRQAGVPCATAAVDVRQREQVHDAVRQIVGALGPVDILIPCAGICRASTVDDLKISELEEIVGINFMGMVYVIEAVLPSMLERNSGQIAGISSMAGVRGIPFEPAYSASKAAVGAYLESLRCELRPRGITITTVFPGYVQTPLLDEINGMMGADMSGGKAFTPNAAAARIVEGLERRSSYIYFPRPLGLSVRLSRLMPPRMYDRVMRRMFSRFSISRRGARRRFQTEPSGEPPVGG